MDRFLEMRTFAAVVEAGSLAKAAAALVMSKAAVSRHLGELENRLGVRLLHRTTRRLSLTDEGKVFHDRCRELLSGVEEAEAEISSPSISASGLIRMMAPVAFGIKQLAPLWSEFMSLHPRVTLDVALLDRAADIVEEGYDMAVRIATEPSSTLSHRRLSTTRLVLCASSMYLDQQGTPRHPEELARHTVIAHRGLTTGDDWNFEGPDGQVSVRTRPRIHTNSGETCRAAALSHLGVVLQPSFLVGEDLLSGRLVELMPEYRAAEFGIYAVYPTLKHISPKVRALTDFLVECFQRPRRAW
jgi:DNA-binding transcriptional LysR family regulator